MPGGRGSTIIEKQLHLVHRKSSFANLHRPPCKGCQHGFRYARCDIRFTLTCRTESVACGSWMPQASLRCRCCRCFTLLETCAHTPHGLSVLTPQRTHREQIEESSDSTPRVVKEMIGVFP